MHRAGRSIIQSATFLLLCTFISLVSACSNLQPDRPDPAARNASLWVPPTLAAIAPVENLGVASEATQSNLTGCINDLTYLDDLTIPDGTFVQRGALLDKQWEVQNTGTCNWIDGYTLQLIAGPGMGANPTQSLFPATSGSKLIIDIKFTAPYEIGTYHTGWQAFDTLGQPFGDPFYIEIVVSDSNP
jgi:hypothetical protein